MILHISSKFNSKAIFRFQLQIQRKLKESLSKFPHLVRGFSLCSACGYVIDKSKNFKRVREHNKLTMEAAARQKQ